MLKKNQKLENFTEAETIIGESVSVKGNFESDGNLIINGSLEGEIRTKGAVLVGEKSKINANISAQEMMIKGNVVGNLSVSGYLAIGENARILGDIECSQISIERGAEINGKVSIDGQGNKKGSHKTPIESQQNKEEIGEGLGESSTF